MRKLKERRKHKRFDLKCMMRYQITMEGNLSDIVIAESRNISQAGLMITTNYAMPVGATIAIEVERDIVREYIDFNKIQSYVELENCPSDLVRIFGTIVRCQKYDDGSYSVGIHLINK